MALCKLYIASVHIVGLPNSYFGEGPAYGVIYALHRNQMVV